VQGLVLGSVVAAGVGIVTARSCASSGPSPQMHDVLTSRAKGDGVIDDFGAAQQAIEGVATLQRDGFVYCLR
jgi:hypothetical protein